MVAKSKTPEYKLENINISMESQAASAAVILAEAIKMNAEAALTLAKQLTLPTEVIGIKINQ